MAENEQTPPTPEPESEDFDWGGFFLDGTAAETPPVAAAPPAPAPAEGDDDEEPEVVVQMKAQIAALTAQVEKVGMTTSQIEHHTRLSTAMEAWKAQASPQELQFADVLAESKDSDDLKQRVEMVKRMTASQGQLEERIRKETELKMQKEFGMPIPPTFSPVPEEEKVNQMLKDGDIDGASNAILKGVFS